MRSARLGHRLSGLQLIGTVVERELCKSILSPSSSPKYISFLTAIFRRHLHSSLCSLRSIASRLSDAVVYFYAYICEDTRCAREK